MGQLELGYEPISKAYFFIIFMWCWIGMEVCCCCSLFFCSELCNICDIRTDRIKDNCEISCVQGAYFFQYYRVLN